MGQPPLGPTWPASHLSCVSCPSDLGEFELPPDHRPPGAGGRPATCWQAGPQQRRSSSRLEHFELEGAPGEEALLAHRRPREKDPATMALVVGALRRSRLCAQLEDNEIESLASMMQYHVYDAGEFVVKEGGVGSSFFVSQGEGLEVVLRGGCLGQIPGGCAFGELALLQRRPRSVSVVATRPGVGVWAADGRLFRRAVQASVMQQASDNRVFLDSVSVLEGLTVAQLDAVGDASTRQVFEVGECPARRGKDSGCVFFVMSGELRVVAGGDRAAGDGGALGPGSCICERALICGEPFSVTVEVTKRSELLCLNLRNLRQVLGSELSPIRLQQMLLQSTLQRSGLFASWAQSQLRAAVQAMEVQEYAPGGRLPDTLRFFVVLDRSVQVGSGKEAQVLRRGQWHGSPPGPDLVVAPQAAGQASPELFAGHRGCRLAVLAATQPRARSDPEPEQGASNAALVLSKVSVFQHLPRCQIDALVKRAARRTYRQGEKVVRQGERGAHFFVVAAGELCAIVDGRVVRRLTQCAYFGERAIMFDERRAATIKVLSAEAELLALEREAFMRVVREKTQTAEQLIYRAWLQDPGIGLKDLRRLGVIGRGNSGVVHLVKHQSSDFKYALKRVEKGEDGIPCQVQREIEVLAENDHPFIMHLVKTMETPRSVYLLTEYVPGGELHAAIRRIPAALTRGQAMFYVGLMVLMLESLSDRSIVYRDLKPENVMLDAQGYLKLIDFGTSRKLQGSCLRAFTMVGTTHYMAPEVMRGKGYGTEVDVWALGVVLYELVCGHLPFGDNAEETMEVCKAVLAGNPQFPPGLDEVTRALVAGLLVTKPRRRLGCGARGYEEVKAAPFFGLDGLGPGAALEAGGGPGGRGSSDLFALLLRRELQAPIPPSMQVLAELDAEAQGEGQEPGGEDEQTLAYEFSKEIEGVYDGLEAEAEQVADAEPEEEDDPEEPSTPHVPAAWPPTSLPLQDPPPPQPSALPE